MLVYKQGFQATGLNQILAQTSLTKGAFYHHFASKMELGYAMIDELLAGLIEEIWLSPLEGCDDPIKGLKNITRTTLMQKELVELGCPLNNLAIEMSLVDEDFRKRVQVIYRNWEQAIVRALERGKNNGAVALDVDSQGAAMFIVTVIAGSRGMAKNTKSSSTLVGLHKQLERYLDLLKV